MQATVAASESTVVHELTPTAPTASAFKNKRDLRQSHEVTDTDCTAQERELVQFLLNTGSYEAVNNRNISMLRQAANRQHVTATRNALLDTASYFTLNPVVARHHASQILAVGIQYALEAGKITLHGCTTGSVPPEKTNKRAKTARTDPVTHTV